MSKNEHYSALENMYLGAPINLPLQPTITITEGKSEIEIQVQEGFFHAAGAVHGSIYFKMLDDAAFFAANSLERDVFVLTSSFTTYLTRPLSSGAIRSVGQVVNVSKTQFIAESIAYNSQGKEISRGNGVFVKSRSLLKDVPGYSKS